MSNCNGHNWSKFWWRDHQRETGLRICSMAARGYWMELLCIMHEADPVGHVLFNGKIPDMKRLAMSIGCTEREARRYEAELEENGVFSRTPEGVIYCRRMAREGAMEASAQEAWKANGSKGGNPKIIRGTVPKEERQRPYRRSDSPLKTERIFRKDGGRCHWCQVPLERDNPLHPHFFHVDHVIAVRDGGTSEEENLVAACQSCNARRARHDDTPPDNPPSGTSDSNQTTAYDSNHVAKPTTTPTSTVTLFRQQPYALARDARSSEEDARKEVRHQKDLPTVFESPERVRVAPNGHAESVPETATVPEPQAKALRIATENIVGKLARKFESPALRPATKYPEHSPAEQVAATLTPPPLPKPHPAVLEAVLAARRDLAERAALRQAGAA